MNNTNSILKYIYSILYVEYAKYLYISFTLQPILKAKSYIKVDLLIKGKKEK